MNIEQMMTLAGLLVVSLAGFFSGWVIGTALATAVRFHRRIENEIVERNQHLAERSAAGCRRTTGGGL